MKKIIKNRQSGFTLIEIAIVLVIIGLLLGGVLKGQEMITQGKIKNVIADLNGIQAAYYGYQDRYRAIPGDDAAATTRWGVPAVAGAAVGSSRVDGEYNSTTDTNESRLFWAHLRGAGFIPGPVSGVGNTTQPINAVGGIVGVQDGNNSLGFVGNIVCSSNLPAKVAQAVDASADDGNAVTGQVRAMLQASTNQSVSGVAITTQVNYVDNGTNEYVVCKQL